MKRIAVVGGGVIGASVALRLAERGAAVTVLDAGVPGEGTSGSTFAWIGASHRGLAPYLELNLLGVRAWRRLAAELESPGWLDLGGCLTWSSDPEEQDRLDARLPELVAAGYRATAVSRAGAERLEPHVDFSRAAGQVHLYHDEGYALARPMIGALLGAARSLGAVVRRGERVVELQCDGIRVAGVVLASGERVAADAVVACCGRWSAELAALAHRDLPMISPAEPGSPAVGLLVLTTPLLDGPGRMLFTDELMIRPDGGGRLLLHSDVHDRLVRAGDATSPAPPAAAALLDVVRPLLREGSSARVESAVIGIRALTADLLPAVGWLDEGLYLVVTHSGVTLAPALGELVAQEVATDREATALRPFRPGRLTSRQVEAGAGGLSGGGVAR
jgi:glycine/D-amino acid oxidase-like deaminating enzyme